MPSKPRIAITLGDAAGIGPEIVAMALADFKLRRLIAPLVVGDARLLQQAAHRSGVRLKIVPVKQAEPWPQPKAGVPVLAAGLPLPGVRPGRWSAQTGKASLAAVAMAADMALHGEADAIVTAPICKQAWQAARVHFPGHTEYLAYLCRTREYAMLFVNGPFRVVLATIHEPLARVPRMLTPERIVSTVRVAVRELRLRFGITRPKVAVAGLNPHAGEGGKFGAEERSILAPAIRTMQKWQDCTLVGPFAPDALFVSAATGAYDLVVCMYHDQGLIPFKLLARDQGVNVTAGLPIIRTSPDHGTAFDLAGTGRANPGSMRAAILTAAEMVRQQRKNKE